MARSERAPCGICSSASQCGSRTGSGSSRQRRHHFACGLIEHVVRPLALGYPRPCGDHRIGAHPHAHPGQSTAHAPLLILNSLPPVPASLPPWTCPSSPATTQRPPYIPGQAPKSLPNHRRPVSAGCATTRYSTSDSPHGPRAPGRGTRIGTEFAVGQEGQIAGLVRIQHQLLTSAAGFDQVGHDRRMSGAGWPRRRPRADDGRA